MDREYRDVVIETYRNQGEASSSAIRARPIAGQGLSTSMKVECSSKMRDTHPPGTLFRVRAKVISREGGPDFLYTNHAWKYQVISRDEANALLRDG